MHVCVFIYTHNKCTQNTYIMQTKTFILFAINRLTARVIINRGFNIVVKSLQYVAWLMNELSMI